MELKQVLLTILKILVSTMLLVPETHAAVLMGGHIDNKNSTSEDDYDYTESSEADAQKTTIKHNSEEIPNPSPLVLPGYNLPENIFNHGKPFYVEKDPLTGKIDFDHKSPSLKSEETDLYDYNEQESDNIYDKKNINRKDGSYGSHHHQQTDVNQLTPNFHDFLNLPVKYNPDKYVYPLISSSYTSTKIQGSVNKFHNHKDTFGVQKTTTTKKPFTTTQTYFTPRTTQRTMATTVVTTTTTTPKPTTVKRYPELTTMQASILNSAMSHPSFNEEYDYYDDTTTSTTQKTQITTASSTTTTKKVMSLFEQLFGDYDETVTTTKATTTTTPKPIISITTQNYYPNIHAGPHDNLLTGSNMGYEYEDEYVADNIAVENKVQENLSVEPLKPSGDKFKKPTLEFTKKPNNFKYSTTTTTHRPSIITTHKPTTTTHKASIITTYRPTTTTTTTTTTHRPSTTIKPTSPRVTSLPLGDNHIGASFNRDPIIVATQNLREKLNSEKVKLPSPQNQLAPSSSSIHIAPGQDTVSFVVGHHQSVGDSESAGQYIGSAIKENSFRPLQVELKPPQIPEVAGSAVTIQPLQNSEASLAIGIPVNGIKQVPGQVMDAALDNDKIHFPKAEGNKVVFPDDKKTIQSNLLLQQDREVLKLNSKPMYHQLPSDLTPPKENDVVAFPSRYQDRPMRPPWDPRPGHFYSGKPEYARPPRPPPEVAYKRIDTLPNILPQFRPNMKHHYAMPPPYHYNRQPLLERPSNNRPIGFFEKMPPHMNTYKRYPPPKNIIYRGPPPLEERRPLAQQPPQSLDERNPIAEDRIINEDPRRPNNDIDLIYQTPPNIHIPNRRNGDSDVEVETLQMIQAKNINNSDEQTTITNTLIKIPAKEPNNNNKSDKTIYKVYPVNNNNNNDKDPEADSDFNFEKHRNEAPVLKPHSRPPSLAIKSDFPYPLERPNNKLEDYSYNNQWNSMQQDENLESRIVTNNQISATLKTFTEKPIAIAYTPTEPDLNADKYSMPNYGSPVIPEIRPGTVENVETGYGGSKNEFTVHATMHTNPRPRPNGNLQFNHKIDVDMDVDNKPHKQQDFQAPFQASVKLDASTNQGWSVVRDKNKTSTIVEEIESTTLSLATTSEFDIENFKPQLIGGFKPIYPEVDGKDVGVAEREEK